MDEEKIKKELKHVPKNVRKAIRDEIPKIIEQKSSIHDIIPVNFEQMQKKMKRSDDNEIVGVNF